MWFTTLRRAQPNVRVGRCVAMIRAVLSVVLAAGLWSAVAPIARADGVEMLMVPSAAMGRDIPVAFQGGGPHAVVLLDAFNAGPDVSNWVTARQRDEHPRRQGHLGGRPGRWRVEHVHQLGAGRQQAVGDVPRRRAARTGWPPTRVWRPSGHGIVGAAQGGTGAVTMATFHPDRYRYAGSLSGFLTPSNTYDERRDHRRAGPVRRRRHPQHVGPATAGPVEVARPRRARRSCWPTTTPGCGCSARRRCGCSDPRGDDRLLRPGPGQQPDVLSALSRRRRAQRALRLPASGEHDWGDWGPQLAAMSGELVTTIK